MRVGSVLVVCVGNICRSVVAERMLRAALPELTISSAGLRAEVGGPADPVTATAAKTRGLSLDGHVARQMTGALGAGHDLILAMTPTYRREIMRLYPHLTGRTMLFDQWTSGRGIADPHGRSLEEHERIIDEIAVAADGWIDRLTVRHAPNVRERGKVWVFKSLRAKARKTWASKTMRGND